MCQCRPSRPFIQRHRRRLQAWPKGPLDTPKMSRRCAASVLPSVARASDSRFRLRLAMSEAISETATIDARGRAACIGIVIPARRRRPCWDRWCVASWVSWRCRRGRIPRRWRAILRVRIRADRGCCQKHHTQHHEGARDHRFTRSADATGSTSIGEWKALIVPSPISGGSSMAPIEKSVDGALSP